MSKPKKTTYSKLDFHVGAAMAASPCRKTAGNAGFTAASPAVREGSPKSVDMGEEDSYSGDSESVTLGTNDTNTDLKLKTAQAAGFCSAIGPAQQVFEERRKPNFSAGRTEQHKERAEKPLWSSLFEKNRDHTQGIKLHTCDKDSSIVIIEPDDVASVEENWGYCLIGHYAGRYPGNIALRSLCDGWNVKHRFFRHNSGWLVFKFETDEDRLQVLNGGPYFSYNRQLLLKYMPPCFEFDKAEICSIPLWVTLPCLGFILLGTYFLWV